MATYKFRVKITEDISGEIPGSREKGIEGIRKRLLECYKKDDNKVEIVELQEVQ